MMTKPISKSRMIVKAFERSDIKTAESLLNEGVDPNTSNSLGQTLLHMTAALHQSTKFANLLFEHDADPFRTDALGRSAAEVARAHDHTRVMYVIRRRMEELREEHSENLRNMLRTGN